MFFTKWYNNKLIEFFADSEQEDSKRIKLGNKLLYVTI